MEKVSLMEEKARTFWTFSEENGRDLVVPQTPEEVAVEISCLRRELKRLSVELKAQRRALRKKEAYFVTLENYKYTLQRRITPVKKVSLKKEKPLSREDKLLQKIEALSPEQLRKLEVIDLSEED